MVDAGKHGAAATDGMPQPLTLVLMGATGAAGIAMLIAGCRVRAASANMASVRPKPKGLPKSSRNKAHKHDRNKRKDTKSRGRHQRLTMEEDGSMSEDDALSYL